MSEMISCSDIIKHVEDKMSVGWSDLNQMGFFHQQKYAHAKDEIGEVRNSSLKYILLNVFA